MRTLARKIAFVSSVGLLVMLGKSNAQTVEFPADPAEFYPVFVKYLEDADKKEFKDQLADFETVWNEAGFDVYKQQFVDFAAKMSKKRMRPLPHFKNYVNAVINFYRSGKLKGDYDSWLLTLDWTMQEKSQSGFNDYLALSAELFKSNTIYLATGHTWTASTNNYIFEPVVDNVKITFPETDIRCFGRGDSTLIEKTSGVLYPLDEKFEGNGGRIYWDRAGMYRDEVFADFTNYTLPLNRATFKADSVLFAHTGYFDEPLYGQVEEKLMDVAEGKTSSYPKFDSYDKRFKIEDIYEDVDYEGGFSFYGNKFLAAGDSVQLAGLIFKYQDKPILRVSSRSFSLEEDKFVSLNAAIVFYLGEDSIFHPTVQFKFLKEKKEVSLLRVDPGLAQKPFTNSFHNVEMFFEAMYWTMGEAFVKISMVKNSAESAANFRSMSYFSELEYERLQGLDMVHPLLKMRDYLKGQGDKTDFTAAEMAKAYRIDISEVRQMLISFSVAGLINYNIDQEIGSTTEKFYSYISAATRVGDYDQIEFISLYSGSNALLSLDDYSMDIKGVSKIMLSDSQNVFIFPLAEEIVLKKNRDFDFGGTIAAGRFTIFGQNCHFSYENFKIDMDDVDSVAFVVPSFKPNEYGERPLKRVKTSIQDLSGEVLIDSPGNKAGLKKFPTYPTLISNKQSYAYYDGYNIERGVYMRDRFYFQIEPFRIDSLDNFANTQIRFKGKLVSADIFPDIEENLKVMPDYSLGFEKNTGAAGLPAYGGKGTFNDTIVLSNLGLKGRGSLKYLTSTLKSRDMIFYPDSANAYNADLVIKKNKSNPDNPDVTGKGAYAHWEPYKDKYELKTGSTPFALYGGEASLSGSVDLTSTVLEGKGVLDLVNAEFISQTYTFKNETFLADTTSFALKDVYTKGADGSQVAFKADNLNAKVSFTDRKGNFTFNDPDAYVDFPKNEFKAKMNELIWNMASGTDSASLASTTLDMKGVKFVATDPHVDTLTINAPKATFSLKDKVIDASDVEYVDVADSRIFPADKKVVIREESAIDPMMDSKVWVGKELRTHTLDSADITIYTLHKYRGNAIYSYIDELGASQRISFDSLDVMKGDITFGEGKLEQLSDFSLSPNFGFRGKVNLYGNNQYLTFTGYVRINHQCAMVTNDYVRFSAEIDPKQILIPVPIEPLNEKNNKLFNGFLFASDTVGLYTAIFTAKRKYSDYEVLRADGYLYYDKNTKEFIVSRREKIFDRTLPGNYLAFNTGDCKSYGEGKIDIGTKMGQVNIESAGNIVYEPVEENTQMEAIMGIDFKMDNTVWKAMETLLGVGAASFDDEKVQRFTADLLDSSSAEKIFNELTPAGLMRKLPKSLEKSMLFGNLSFKWDKELKSFVHNGEVDLFVFNGTQVMQQGLAIIEINRKASGDGLNIYLEIGDNWYFFSYRSNIMSVMTSSTEINTIITELDTSKKQFMEDGQATYSFTIANQRKVDRFKEQFGLQ